MSERLGLTGSLFDTKPDIIVTSPRGKLIILDTKYKPFDEAFRPAEADVDQLLTCCVTRGAAIGYLVYPGRQAGQVPKRYTIARSGTTLWTWPIILGGRGHESSTIYR